LLCGNPIFVLIGSSFIFLFKLIVLKKSEENKRFYFLFEKFLMIVREEENLAPRFSMRFTLLRLLLAQVGLCLLCFLAGIFLWRMADKAELFKSAAELDSSQQIIKLLTQVDSLSMAMEQKEAYIERIRQVIEGDAISDKTRHESEVAQGVRQAIQPDLDRIDSADMAFRKQYEESKYDIQVLKSVSGNEEIKQMVLFPPVSGVLINKFDAVRKHYGVDVLAKKNEPIKAISEGAVIFASWTQDSGHVIGIQHKNQLISFYKHNSTLLKKVGDVVKAGEIIAIIGNSGELTDGPHLHFELWFSGNPVDPSQFIAF
jgi:murein DD-endopeptidase MepM/ murein hydrolase activator NlpD